MWELYKFDPVNAPGEKRIQQRIWSREKQWDRIKAWVTVTPGMGSASEFVRLACCEVLALPPPGLTASCDPYWPAVKSYRCPKCGKAFEFDPTNVPGEKRTRHRIWFPESMWRGIVARAKVTRGVGSASEVVRLACEDVLAIPPRNLLISWD